MSIYIKSISWNQLIHWFQYTTATDQCRRHCGRLDLFLGTLGPGLGREECPKLSPGPRLPPPLPRCPPEPLEVPTGRHPPNHFLWPEGERKKKEQIIGWLVTFRKEGRRLWSTSCPIKMRNELAVLHIKYERHFSSGLWKRWNYEIQSLLMGLKLPWC